MNRGTELLVVLTMAVHQQLFFCIVVGGSEHG
jgi:hypothetical protein